MPTSPHRRRLDLALLRRDTRGAQLVEYVLLVGLVALVALVGLRAFGESVKAKAEAQARCVESLSCGDGSANAAAATPGAGGESPPPPSPTGAVAGAAAAVVSGATTGDGTAAKAPTQLQYAKTFVKAGGSATQADVDAVAEDLATLPRPVLDYMKAKGITVVAAKNSVTDYMTHLKGVKPRGWPPGSGWDSVPGTVNHNTEVVIATRNGKVPATGDGHGAYSLTVHETFHAIDRSAGWSKAPEFLKARDADAANLDAYLKQPGEAGLEEAYAESAAHYFRGDTAWGKKNPNLWQYWETHAPKLRKP
jgi:Flp pilus assembly pilin Flp